MPEDIKTFRQNCQKAETITLCLCIILCSIIYSSQTLDKDLTIRWLAFAVFTFVGFAIFSVKNISAPAKAAVRGDGILLLLIILSAITIISGFRAINKGLWLYESLKICTMTVFLIVAADIEDKNPIIKTVICISLCLGLYGLYEILKLKDPYLIKGTMSHRNPWSAAMALILPFTFYGIGFGGRWRKISGASAAFLIFNIIYLNCRAAIMGLAAAAIVAAVIKNKKLLIPIVICGLVMILWRGERLLDSASLQARLRVWRASAGMISLFGCGAGNWPVEIGRYALGVKISGFCERLFFQRPHNDFIWAACETGIAGFIVYCSIFYKAVKRAINNQSTFILAGLIIYICCAFFSFPRERTFHTIMLLVYLSFLPPGKLCVSKGVFYFSQLIMVIVLLAAICDFTVRYRADEAAKSIRETNSPAEIIEILQISELADIDAYSSPFAWHKGRAYLQIGQIKAAIIEFKKAIKASPYHIGALDNLATALAISGSTESAEEYLQRAIAVRGDCMGMGNKLKIIRQINEMKNENFKE